VKHVVICAVVFGLSWLSCSLLGQESGAHRHLPSWSEEDWSSHLQAADPSRQLGGLLWPEGGPDSLFVLPPLRGMGWMDSPDAAQPQADVSGFLPPSLMRPHESGVSSTGAAGTPRALVDNDFIQSAYAADPTIHLIDPGYELTEHEREDIERFLSYHARDAQIAAYVLILGANEELPKTFDMSKLAGGGLLKDNRCLLVMPYGEPHRARLFFTSNLHKDATQVQLTGILADCVAHGTVWSEPYEQIHRFLVRLSIRLFWLENVLLPAVPPPVPLLPSQAEVRPTLPPAPTVTASSRTAPKPALTEVGVPLQSPTAKEGIMLRVWKWLPWVLLLATVGVFALYRWRRYKLRHYEWVFDHLPMPEERLGGVHCGGGGAWMSYAAR
jgi:hypothetical protein